MATHLGIVFRFRVHTKERRLWNNMGALCIDSDYARPIEIANDFLGGSTVNNICYDTSPIVSNESLGEAGSESDR